jgi:hypothetical protein
MGALCGAGVARGADFDAEAEVSGAFCDPAGAGSEFRRAASFAYAPCHATGPSFQAAARSVTSTSARSPSACQLSCPSTLCPRATARGT